MLYIRGSKWHILAETVLTQGRECFVLHPVQVRLGGFLARTVEESLTQLPKLASCPIKKTAARCTVLMLEVSQAFEGLEANWASSTAEGTARACVLVRMCVMDMLDPWVQEPPARRPHKPSFFRSENRKMHIMKALMPPAISPDVLQEMRMQ